MWMNQARTSFKCSHSSWRSSLTTIWLKINQESLSLTTCLIQGALMDSSRRRQIRDQSIPPTTDQRPRINSSKWSRLWWYHLRTSTMSSPRISRCKFISSISGLPGVNSPQQLLVTLGCRLENTWSPTLFHSNSLRNRTIHSMWWWAQVILLTGGWYLALKSNQSLVVVDRIPFRRELTQLL